MHPPDDTPRTSFFLGNMVLAVAAIMLFFFGEIWERLGAWGLLAWMILVVLGVYLIWRDRDPSPPGPPA